MTNKARSLLFSSCITFIINRDSLDFQLMHSDMTKVAVSLFSSFIVLWQSIFHFCSLLTTYSIMGIFFFSFFCSVAPSEEYHLI